MNRLLALAVFLFIVFKAEAQGAKQDTVFLSSSIKSTKALYVAWLGAQSHLYNGGSPKTYNDDIVDLLPYYLPDWEDGSVYYDRELYEGVPLMYDLITDKVIVSQVRSYSEIELISSKVDWFTIGEASFFHLGPAVDLHLEDGFYQRLYDGNTKLFVRRKKIIEDNIENNALVHEISAVDRYFICKEGKYTPVKKLSSVLDVLPDKAKELKSYSKKNRLDFRKKAESSLTLLVRHYDQAKQE